MVTEVNKAHSKTGLYLHHILINPSIESNHYNFPVFDNLEYNIEKLTIF